MTEEEILSRLQPGESAWLNWKQYYVAIVEPGDSRMSEWLNDLKSVEEFRRALELPLPDEDDEDVANEPSNVLGNSAPRVVDSSSDSNGWLHRNDDDGIKLIQPLQIL
jgi:hypothetical protein